MRGCAIRFGVKAADEIQAMVERATGEQCPCMSEKACPIFSAPSDGVAKAMPLIVPIEPLAPVNA